MNLRQLKEFYFTIDRRSLGLFRIALGLLLIADWTARWPNLEAFYTSFGVLPADAPLPRAGGPWHFSMLDGALSLPMVQLLFCLGLVCYLCLLAGYRTRLFAALSFVFYISVLTRNVLIRDGSDVALATMFMWSLFLPLGARYSVDAIGAQLRRSVPLRGPPVAARGAERAPPSLAAFAIVLQIGLIYFFTAIVKTGQPWRDATALYYALQIDQLANPLGLWLSSRFEGLLRPLTWLVLGLEYAALPLMMMPLAQPWPRRLAIVSLTGLHLGIWLCMDIGLFPLVMIGALTLLLSDRDWDLIRRVMLRGSRPVTVVYDDTCGLCHRGAQLLKIADCAGHVTFVGSSESAAHPRELSRAETDRSIIVFDPTTQSEATTSSAVARLFAALPLPFHLLRLIALPGLRNIADVAYDFIARRRHQISRWLGHAACGAAAVATTPRGEPPQDSTPPLRRWRRACLRAAANAAAAVMLAAILLSGYNHNIAERFNLPRVRPPALLTAIIECPQLVQDWHLFAPHPMTDDGWWVIDGVLESGESFDPLTGRPTSWEKPRDLTKRFDRFWRKYLYRLWLQEFSEHRLYFGRYITRLNHREQPEGRRLSFFDLYYMLETTPPPGLAKPFAPKRILLWSHNCFAPDHDHDHHAQDGASEAWLDAEFHAGLAAYLAGDYRLALERIHNALERFPNNAEGYVLLGNVFAEQGNHAQAGQAYEVAVKLNPRLAEAWYNLGVTHVEDGRDADAIQALRRATTLQPEHPGAWIHLGSAFLRQGNPSRASEAFNTATGLDPQSAEAWLGWGAARSQQGDFTGAAEAFQESARLRPGYAEAWFNLGLTRVRLGQVEQARQAVARLRELDAEMAAHLAAILDEAGPGDKPPARPH
jgi:tetratricopeptide (TPR) repeat protein/predicted DCC family thiol-disulfide oxidoreductase YuxK